MRYLGLDLGTKTLGIAISDRTNTIATSITILRHNDDFNLLVDELKKIVSDNDITTFVLGLPKNMNNTITTRGEYILSFKEVLENNFDIPVILEDERLTTKIAENILISADVSRKKRKKVIDKMAANVILQSYLDRRSNGKE